MTNFEQAAQLLAVPRPRQGAASGVGVLPAAWAHAYALGSGCVAVSARLAETAQQIDGNQNIYMTRVNASGDGASGPHPEREPA